MILVSACLAGFPCSYDGEPRTIEKIKALVEAGEAFPVCPEELGGLPTPREIAEIVGGDGSDVLEGQAKVITRNGENVTQEFILGAYRVLEIAKKYEIFKAVLKANSPSCGVGLIYDGSFQGNLKKGDGVLVTLLKREGIKVVSDSIYRKEQSFTEPSPRKIYEAKGRQRHLRDKDDSKEGI